MSLHPDIIDAMVAAGASAGMDPGAVLAMVQAACRAAWNVAQQATTPPPVAPVRRETPSDIAEEMRGIADAMRALDLAGYVQRPATDVQRPATVQRSSTGRPQTSTERSRKHRAAKAMQRADVSTALHPVASAAPLSLDLSLKAKTALEVENSGEIALPDGWQPDDKSKAIAVEALGEGAAAALTGNFRDHYGSRPTDKRTMTQWQATYRKWARSERKRAASPQGDLPLMRRVQNREGPSYRERWDKVVQETIARRETG